MFDYTQAEKQQALSAFFSDTENLKLIIMPSKQKKKYIVLKIIAELFSDQKSYTEKEVNAILEAVHDDYVTLRRYLVDYRILAREADGSRYWLKEQKKNL